MQPTWRHSCCPCRRRALACAAQGLPRQRQASCCSAVPGSSREPTKGLQRAGRGRAAYVKPQLCDGRKAGSVGWPAANRPKSSHARRVSADVSRPFEMQWNHTKTRGLPTNIKNFKTGSRLLVLAAVDQVIEPAGRKLLVEGQLLCLLHDRHPSTFKLAH